MVAIAALALPKLSPEYGRVVAELAAWARSCSLACRPSFDVPAQAIDAALANVPRVLSRADLTTAIEQSLARLEHPPESSTLGMREAWRSALIGATAASTLLVEEAPLAAAIGAASAVGHAASAVEQTAGRAASDLLRELADTLRGAVTDPWDKSRQHASD